MYKRFIAWFIIISIVFGLAVCSLVYVMDPLYLYHKLNKDNFYGATERYQMPGLIKNMEYDTLLVGTSMGRNFVEEEVNKWFNSKSFNGSLPASTAREQRMVADLSVRNHRLKNMIWELNYYSFSNEPDWVEEGSSPFPTYMYDDNVFNDIKYLLNPYSRKMAFITWTANQNKLTYHRDPYKLYKFGDEIEKYTIENSRERLENAAKRPINDAETAKIMMESFESNVVSFVEDNPEINFKFFFAPYSIVIPVEFNKMDPMYTQERIKFKKYVYERLSQFENVDFYDFQDNKEVVYNVANYMSDGIHYYRYVNDWIIKELTTTKAVEDEKQYNKRLDQYEEMINNFDLSQLRFDPRKSL